MKNIEQNEVESSSTSFTRYATPQIHDNGSVTSLTAGADSADDEESIQKCIDGPLGLIPPQD